MGACPDDEQLAGFGGGRDTARADVAAHLDECESCRDVVAAFARQSAFLARVEGSEPDPTDGDEVAVGTRLGRYQVIGHLGRGAMGRVVLGYDDELDRQVALKVLDDDSRLIEEAAALARLSHPNVVAVYEIGTAGERRFLAMERIDGVSLTEWLAAAPRTWREVVATLVELGRGLEAVHESGLVHRDVKPDNVLVGADGRVRLGDFGLATRSPAAAGERAGTPAYMAREQAAGEALDARADLVGFAVTAWEALTGRVPKDPSALDWSLVPARVRPILARACAADPDDRPDSVGAVVAALERAAAGPKRRAAAAAAVAAAAVVAAIGAIAVFDLGGSSPTPCEGGEAAWGETWTAARRESVRAAGAGPTLLSHLDSHATRWLETYRHICRATAVEHTQSEALLDRRMACLEEQRVETAAAIERVMAEDDLAEAWPHLGALDPEGCRRIATAFEREGSRRRRLALTAEIAAAKSEEDLPAAGETRPFPDLHVRSARILAAERDARGDTSGAIAALDRALADVQTRGGPEPRAEALAARLLYEIQRRESLERGAFLAGLVRAIEPDLAASTRAKTSSLRALSAYHQWRGDPAEADSLLARAERAPGTPLVRAEIAADRCLTQTGAGRIAEAAETCERAEALLSAALGADHRKLAVHRINRAGQLGAAGHFEEAARLSRRGVANLARHLGPDHIMVAVTRRNLGSSLANLGDHRGAMEHFEAVLPRFRDHYGAASHKVAALLTDIAQQADLLGDDRRALAITGEVLDVYRELEPEGHPDYAMALLGHAELLWEAGQRPAIDIGERAAAMAAATLGPEHPDRIHSLYFLAQVRAERGERAAALATIDTCLGLRELGRPQRFLVLLLRASVLSGPRRKRALDAAEALAETDDERAEIAALRK
jgi:tetratricopeptide (TPR) repeat protein/predicted Ser/Thr protein kinase